MLSLERSMHSRSVDISSIGEGELDVVKLHSMHSQSVDISSIGEGELDVVKLKTFHNLFFIIKS